MALISSSLYDENFYHQADQIYQKNPNFKNGSLSFNGRGIPFGFYPVSLNVSELVDFFEERNKINE